MNCYDDEFDAALLKVPDFFYETQRIVYKFGSTTDFTEGEIVDEDYYHVGLDKKEFKNQMLILGKNRKKRKSCLILTK
jgi:hypothetical protein